MKFATKEKDVDAVISSYLTKRSRDAMKRSIDDEYRVRKIEDEQRLGVPGLKSFLKDLQEFGMKNNPPSCLRTLLASKACRGAIMFGDKLNNQECKILIANLADTQMPFFCAHGRPSAVPLGSIF